MHAPLVPVQVLVAPNPFSTPHIYEELTTAESVAGDDPEQNVTKDCALWGARRIFLLTFLFIP